MHAPVARSVEQRQRVELAQAHVLGQLVLAPVELLVGQLHALEVEVQPLAGEQPLPAGEVAVAQERAARVAQLVLQRALGLAGDVEGELEALRVQAAHLPAQPACRTPRWLVLPVFARRSGTARSRGVRICCWWLCHSRSAIASRIWAARSCLKVCGDLAGGGVALERPVLLAAGVAGDPRRCCRPRRSAAPASPR